MAENSKEIKISKQNFQDASTILNDVYKEFQNCRNQYIATRPAICTDWNGEGKIKAEEEFRSMEKQLEMIVNNMETLKSGIKKVKETMEEVDESSAETIK